MRIMSESKGHCPIFLSMPSAPILSRKFPQKARNSSLTRFPLQAFGSYRINDHEGLE